MNAWKIVCATLVIFITGIITGASLVRFAERGQKPWQRMPKTVASLPLPPNHPALPNDPRPANAASSGSPLLNREFVQILARQLRLTPEQRERIGQIMADGQERMREIRASLEPQTRKQLSETREQIHALLTPEQRPQFEQLVKQRAGRRSEGSGQPERERRFRDQRTPLTPRDTLPGGESGAAPLPRNPAPPQ
ncbi:MAG: hypothetical protein V9H26_24445 [Verrucomicrobiota bacterium]|nr:hypothetical protein [Limisphaerales bacterium]